MKTSHTDPVARAFAQHRYNVVDLVLLAAAVATFFLADLYLALATAVLIMIVFALSLDIAQGYGGVETLGHAAFFGTGAYAAGLYAMHVSSEPLSGLVVGMVAAAVVGLVSGLAVLRTTGLTQIMLTLVCATLLLELANVAKPLTMGDDGLTGYSVAPVLGLFQFDIEGRTAYWYALAVLVLAYAFCKFLVSSPLGLTARGVRENPTRMALLGVPVRRRLLALYAISAALAGAAGALSAQVNNIVGLDSLGFTMSANVLVMLALGGTGRLYGAFLGAIVFMLLADRAAALDPTNWLAALGVLLIIVVRFAPTGLSGCLARWIGKEGAR